MRRDALLVVTGLMVGFAAVAQAADPVGPFDPKIEGWGPFKFGMTLRQVRELDVDPISWGSVENLDYRLAVLPARQPVAAFGSMYGLDLEFGWGQRLFARDKKLSGVRLSRSTAASPEQCERDFRSAILKLEAHYGPLIATDTPKEKAGSLPGEAFEVSRVRMERSFYSRSERLARRSVGDPLVRRLHFAAERRAEGKVSVDNLFWATMVVPAAWTYEGCHVTIKIEGKPPASILD